MPLSDEEYRDILQHIRVTLRQAGFGSIDDRIINGIRQSEGAYHDVVLYLKKLINELSLGSNECYRETIRRIRHNARTSNGGEIKGIRVYLQPEEQMRYDMDYIDLSQTAGVESTLIDLKTLLGNLIENHSSD